MVRPRMRSNRVVLPAPLVPNRPTISPWAMLKDISLSAWIGLEDLLAKDLLTPDTSMAGGCAVDGLKVLIPGKYP